MRNWGEATKIDRRRRGFFFSAPCFFYSPTSHKNWETERRMIGDGEVSKKKRWGCAPPHTHTHTKGERQTRTHTHTETSVFLLHPYNRTLRVGGCAGGCVFVFIKNLSHTQVFFYYSPYNRTIQTCEAITNAKHSQKSVPWYMYPPPHKYPPPHMYRG